MEVLSYFYNLLTLCSSISTFNLTERGVYFQ